MEATGRYHEPVAMELHDHGIFVSVVNPLVIHGYCSGGTVRKVKNDQKDSLKTAKFALDHWVALRVSIRKSTSPVNSESNPSTKRGSPHLRKTLFQLMTVYLRLSPADEAVYQFLGKKRAEGKPYYVYMTAGANKFLRIYYARVKECMAKLETPDETAEENG